MGRPCAARCWRSSTGRSPTCSGPTPASSPDRSAGRGPDELPEERPYASVDLVADRPHLVDRLAGRVGEIPVEVALPGEDGTGVATPHRDDDVCRLYGVRREGFRELLREV